MQSNSLLQVLIKIKKKFLPTQYDKEQRELYKARLHFYSQFIKKGDVCFDVGANVGDRTALFLELGAKVVAVEPQESCCKILEKRFGNKITLIKKGVGSKAEMKDFYISNQHSQVSSFSKDWIDDVKKDRFKNVEWNEVKQIEIVTLDSLVEKFGTPHFIKIDVEGFEYEVLKGLTKPFKCLSFEFAIPENNVGLNNCINYLNTITKTLKFNYAIQDNTNLELTNWVSFNEMDCLTATEGFQSHFAGDIYVNWNY
jgi:FkbM family methyltransferase